MAKWVFTFGDGKAEGRAEMRDLLGDLARRGYHATDPVQAGARATPVTLDGSDGKQYWLGFQNYYAITRYNISKMYAMAVFQLSQAIAGKELPPA